MEHYRTEFIAITGVAGSFLASLFGGWDSSLQTLILLMAVDYITGLMLAGIFHKSPKTPSGALQSKAGWQGLCKKGMTLLIVLVAHQLDITMNVEYIRQAVVIGFIANEVISITENAGLMGIPLPAVITKAIDILTSKAVSEVKQNEQ